MTESLENKVRDNFHTVLLARNLEGVKEINALISQSTDDKHFYYTNRVSFDEFFNLSNNVIKISACLASPLNQLPLDHPLYERLAKTYDYFEIQYHDCQEQKDYNLLLARLAKKYHKKLIARLTPIVLTPTKQSVAKYFLFIKAKVMAMRTLLT